MHYAPGPPARRRRLWPWLVGAGAVVLAGLITAGVVVAVNVTNQASGPAAAVVTFNEAWNEFDCDLNNSVTTGDLNFDDCDEFETQVHDFLDGTTDYKATVTNTTVNGDSALVITRETYETDGTPHTDIYTYSLEKQDGEWLITTIELQD